MPGQKCRQKLKLDQLVDYVVENLVKRDSVLKGNGPNKVLRFPRSPKGLVMRIKFDNE